MPFNIAQLLHVSSFIYSSDMRVISYWKQFMTESQGIQAIYLKQNKNI